jgi:subtilisin family serine protease
MNGTPRPGRTRLAVLISAVVAVAATVVLLITLAVPDTTQLQATGPTTASTDTSSTTAPAPTTTDPAVDPAASTTPPPMVTPVPPSDPNGTSGAKYTELTVVEFTNGQPSVRVVPVGSPEASDALARAANDPTVIVDPNITYTPMTADPLRYQQWALDQLHVDQVFALNPTVQGSGVKVAVLDSGVVSGSVDLVGRIFASHDFLAGQGGSREHGTGVAGIIAANNANGIGGTGVAPLAQILDARVCDPATCPNDVVINGLIWAVQNGASVINLSLGSPTLSTSMAAVIEWAVNQGVVVVGAAGNTGCSLQVNGVDNVQCLRTSRSFTYPGALPDVIAVAAIDQGGTRPYYSGYGTPIDIGAPTGVMAPGQTPDGYWTFFGTSSATPHVAAVAALLKSVAPSLTPAQIQAVLQASTTTYPAPLTQQTWTSCSAGVCSGQANTTATQHELGGAGEIDALAAVNLAKKVAAATLNPAPAFAIAGSTANITFSTAVGTTYSLLVDGRAPVSPVTATPGAPGTIALNGLTTDTQYAVTVRATTGAVTKDSEPVLVTIATPPPIKPIVHANQVVNAGSLTIQVDNAPAAIHDLVLRAVNGSFVQQCSNTSNLPAHPELFACDFFLLPNMTTIGPVIVEYIDASGNLSPPSDSFTLTNSPSLTLATPQLIPAPGNTTAHLDWALIPGATSYLFHQGDNACTDRTITASNGVVSSGTGTCIPVSCTVDSTNMACDMTGLTNGVEYFEVVGAQGSGNASSQFAFTYVRPEPTPLAAPLTVTAGAAITDPFFVASMVPIQWSAVPGASGYNVYASDGTTTALPAAPTTFDYFIGSLPPSAPLTFRVQATKDSNGTAWTTLGTPSAPFTATVPTFSPPTLSGCGRSGTNVTCSLTAPANYDPNFYQYQVELRSAGGTVLDSKTVLTPNSSPVSVQFTNVAPGGTPVVFAKSLWRVNVISRNSAWSSAAVVDLSDMVTIVPTRALDTRNSPPAIGNAASRDLAVTGLGGFSGSAKAAILNVTAVFPTAGGYLTIWPACQTRPLASNLNFTPGQIIPNMVIVGLGTGPGCDGKISIFNSAGNTEVVVDVLGYVP